MQPAIVFVGSQLSTWLSVTFDLIRVTVPPLLKMPPPWAAVLRLTSLCFSVTSPPGSMGARPLEIPPPLPPALLPSTFV